MLLGKDSNALRKILPEWLYRVVYCLHYTPNPVFFHQVARWSTWPQRRKKRCHVCILNWQRCMLYTALNLLNIANAITVLVFTATDILYLCITPFTLVLLSFRGTNSPPGRFSNPVRSWSCNHSHSWLVENYQLTSNRQLNGTCGLSHLTLLLHKIATFVSG